MNGNGDGLFHDRRKEGHLLRGHDGEGSQVRVGLVWEGVRRVGEGSRCLSMGVKGSK
jgi:hypothetical protein